MALGCAAGTAPAVKAKAFASPSAVPPAEARRRADAALAALVARFWNGSHFEMSPRRPDDAPYWLNAQALDAVLDGVERTGGRWADVARALVAGQDARGWRSDYFDDESWMALALIRAADILGDPGLLARAEALLDDIISGASDRTCCGSRPGGLWWDRRHTQKATASNAGPVIAAARLYERTGDARLLEFARRVFAYWLAEMVDPATGQVADHELPTGAKVWWRFTYNEGTMIGAALALRRATGDDRYLGVARKIGGFSLAHETGQSRAGTILTDGPSCRGDCDQFKGIAQRYLAALAEADPGGPWGALVARDGIAVWTLSRDAGTATFGTDWGGPPGAPTLASQSSAAMGLAGAASMVRDPEARLGAGTCHPRRGLSDDPEGPGVTRQVLPPHVQRRVRDLLVNGAGPCLSPSVAVGFVRLIGPPIIWSMHSAIPWEHSASSKGGRQR